MTDIECLQKLSTISGYCCAQKDKDALDHAMQIIKSQKHGTWLHTYWGGWTQEDADKVEYRCSECGAEFTCIKADWDWDYCPQCGAHMDKEAADVISESK